jgi:DNA-directed RNA polymerase subunit RPC12/RpoP
MSAMKFACPECTGHILADDTALGATVECPHCGKRIGLVELNLVASTNEKQIPARSGSHPVVAQPSAESPPGFHVRAYNNKQFPASNMQLDCSRIFRPRP